MSLAGILVASMLTYNIESGRFLLYDEQIYHSLAGTSEMPKLSAAEIAEYEMLYTRILREHFGDDLSRDHLMAVRTKIHADCAVIWEATGRFCSAWLHPWVLEQLGGFNPPLIMFWSRAYARAGIRGWF